MIELQENELFLFRQRPILVGRDIYQAIIDFFYRKYYPCMTTKNIIDNPEKFSLGYIHQVNLEELSKDSVIIRNGLKSKKEIILKFNPEFQATRIILDKRDNIYEIFHRGVEKKTVERFRKLLKQNNFHSNISIEEID